MAVHPDHPADWRFRAFLFAFLALALASCFRSAAPLLAEAAFFCSIFAALFMGMVAYYIGGKRLVVLYGFLLAMLAMASWGSYAQTDLLVYHAAVSAGVCCLIASFPKHKSIRLLLALSALILFVAFEVGIGGYHFITGRLPGYAQIFAVSESTFRESFGYITSHSQLVPFLVLFFCGSAAFLFVTSKAALPLLKIGDRVVVCALLGLMFCTALSTEAHLYDRLPLLGMVISNYHSDIAYYNVAKARKPVVDTIGAVRKSDFKPAVYVVAVGESANRHHLGAYGYFRDTTPRIDRRKDQLVAFSDAISSFSTTLMSLRRALTLATVESGKEYSDPDMFSIIEIMRGAGFKTYWFSNQTRWGFWGNHVSRISLGVDNLIMLEDNQKISGGPNSSTDFRRLIEFKNNVYIDGAVGYDADLLPPLERALAEDKGPSIIFLHLNGSHGPYIFGCPEKFRKFAEREDQAMFGQDIDARRVNSYDNTIYYTDYILDEIIRRLEQLQLPTSLLYFSDHGESVYLGKEHDPSDFGPGHVEVPLLLWFSSSYSAAYPETVAQARAHADSPFMLDSLSQLVMDWAHVDGPFYKPARSPLNANFVPAPRLTMDGSVNYDSLKQNYCTVTREKTGFSLGPC